MVSNLLISCYQPFLPGLFPIPGNRTGPAGAGHFGDFADPESNVSILTAERSGFDLMPEQDTKPVNKYLPPRPKADVEQIDILAPLLARQPEETGGFLGWLDRTLEKL